MDYFIKKKAGRTIKHDIPYRIRAICNMCMVHFKHAGTKTTGLIKQSNKSNSNF